MLLLFAIGIDDAFVIMAAYDHTDSCIPIQERMAWTLSDAGFTISITSFTNASAFFIGPMTGLPALKSFCVWAGIGILFVYLFQSTLFIACATLDAHRRANDCMDVLICLPAKIDHGELNIFGQKHGVIERFFENKYVPFIFNNKVRFPILIFTLGIFSTCVYGMSKLRQNFDISFFYSGYIKRKKSTQLRQLALELMFTLENLITNQLRIRNVWLGYLTQMDIWLQTNGW